MLRTLFSLNPGRFLDSRAERRREIKKNLRRATLRYLEALKLCVHPYLLPRSFKTARKHFCKLQLIDGTSPHFAYHRQALNKL